MVASSRQKAMELVRCQILADDEVSIQRLQDQLESTPERLERYSETVGIILERLLERFPKAFIMVFERQSRFSWRLVVAESTKWGAEDHGTVALARRIRSELGADWLEITGPVDKP